MTAPTGHGWELSRSSRHAIKDRRKRVEPVGNERRTGRERREHRRVLVSMEVDYRCDNTFLFAYITDLSAMGIFIQTSAPHPPGTSLNLRFPTTGQRATRRRRTGHLGQSPAQTRQHQPRHGRPVRGPDPGATGTDQGSGAHFRLL
jgi:hypothetical protein